MKKPKSGFNIRKLGKSKTPKLAKATKPKKAPRPTSLIRKAMTSSSY